MSNKIEHSEREADRWLDLVTYLGVATFVVLSAWLWASTAESVVVSTILSGLANCF